MKKMKVYPLVFNATGMVALVDDKLPCLVLDLPHPSVDVVRAEVSQVFGQGVFVGDILLEDVTEEGDTFVMMTFVEHPEKVASWSNLAELDDDFARSLHMHLTQTLYNANNMRVGYCYENIKTGEAICVIHAIDDRVKNKRFLVVESTMAPEPMVIPADAYWGTPMQWISHARFVEIVSNPPVTLVDKAKHFFITAHNSINQRYDGKPYSHHLVGVNDEFHKYKHLIPKSDWEQVEAELWGHDALEDTNLTFNDIKSELGEAVAEGCYSMTNEKGRNRAERASFKYYKGLIADKYGEFKKMCDRLANVRNSVGNGHSMGRAYKKELIKFEKSLRTNGDVYSEMWDDLKKMLEHEEGVRA